MTNRSSFMLAVLLIANPFMLLFFQNCSQTRQIASDANREIIKSNNSVSVESKSNINPH